MTPSLIRVDEASAKFRQNESSISYIRVANEKPLCIAT